MIFNQKVVQLTGRRIALTPPVNFTATPGNEQVSLTWEDPGDATSGGVVVAEWEFTQIVRKVGSPPVNQTDGTIVTISDVKNQYLSEPFVDTGLTNGTTYYYGAFACSKAGAWSDGAFAGAIPVASVALGSLAEGTLVKIKENGTPVEFYVAKQGYEPTLNGPNRVLMVRKDGYNIRNWAAGTYNKWEVSAIRSWLSGEYLSFFSSTVQSFIGTTKYYYTPEGMGYEVQTISDPVFLLSATELDVVDQNMDFNVEGSVLPISSSLKIVYVNGVLNSIYKSTLSTAVQTMISTTTFPYTPGNGNSSLSSFTASVFLLSLYELGRTTSYVNNEGSQLPISSYLQNLSQWTRSPYYNSTISVAFLAANGNIFGDNPNYSEGARPVFTLPSTALVDGNLALIEEV